ncbi:uncharacterized protein DNG_04973 [Cephalotrichum gorgonifer]|uniref:Uncharacterized protein n=1 Tax=Cephalotrichum gorgonifer TaxID=2041049 RepID=A0AAE8MXM8_9PEZI|nr:uncharacterized protein DNG_04973 [Cephalotrichum gorgonifer]
MSCCRALIQRATHSPTSITPLSLLSRSFLRARPLPASSPKLILTRNLSVTRLRANSPSQSPRPAAQNQNQNLYPPPDKSKRYLFPERVVIYHAGTGRVLYLAVLKLTTVVLSAVFCGVLVPSYIAADKPLWESACLAVCGIIPLTFVAFTTAPFVSIIHVHLPPLARHSRESLSRFVRSMPPQTRLQATTLSLIAKPRVSYFTLGELRPARERWGIVNYARDTERENQARKWWNFRAVGGFNVQGSNRGVKEAWIWDAVKEKLAARGAAGSA